MSKQGIIFLILIVIAIVISTFLWWVVSVHLPSKWIKEWATNQGFAVTKIRYLGPGVVSARDGIKTNRAAFEVWLIIDGHPRRRTVLCGGRFLGVFNKNIEIMKSNR